MTWTLAGCSLAFWCPWKHCSPPVGEKGCAAENQGSFCVPTLVMCVLSWLCIGCVYKRSFNPILSQISLFPNHYIMKVEHLGSHFFRVRKQCFSHSVNVDYLLQNMSPGNTCQVDTVEMTSSPPEGAYVTSDMCFHFIVLYVWSASLICPRASSQAQVYTSSSNDTSFMVEIPQASLVQPLSVVISLSTAI